MSKNRKSKSRKQTEQNNEAYFERLAEIESTFPEYTWCLHCERVYKTEKWGGYCPNCEAYEFTEGWHWGKLVLCNGYPEEPEEGKRYPLYPEKES